MKVTAIKSINLSLSFYQKQTNASLIHIVQGKKRHKANETSCSTSMSLITVLIMTHISIFQSAENVDSKENWFEVFISLRISHRTYIVLVPHDVEESIHWEVVVWSSEAGKCSKHTSCHEHLVEISLGIGKQVLHLLAIHTLTLHFYYFSSKNNCL